MGADDRVTAFSLKRSFTARHTDKAASPGQSQTVESSARVHAPDSRPLESSIVCFFSGVIEAKESSRVLCKHFLLVFWSLLALFCQWPHDIFS